MRRLLPLVSLLLIVLMTPSRSPLVKNLFHLLTEGHVAHADQDSAQQANRRLMVVVPITLGLICLMLCADFHSLRNTALILLNIPLARVGGILALARGVFREA